MYIGVVGFTPEEGTLLPRPIVRYANIAGMGRVRWALFDESVKSLYLALEAQPANGRPSDIDRLRQVNQLGVIAHAIEQAHHRRWEYLALTLNLVRIVGYSGGEGGLASPVKVGDKKVTKADLIAAWMLILQSGHLWDTFAAERYVTYEAARCPLVKQALLEPIDDEMKPYCAKIVDEQRWTQMYKVLALRRLSTVFKNPEDLAFATDCMRVYCTPPNDSIATGKEALRVFSQLAFTYLDSQFTDRNILIDPVAVALRMHEDAGMVGRILDSTDPLGRVFQATLEYLDAEVYVARETLPHVHRVLQALSDKHHADLNSNDYATVRTALHNLLQTARYESAYTTPDRVYGFSLHIGDGATETVLYDSARQQIGRGWYKMLVSSLRSGDSSSIHFLPNKNPLGAPVLSKTHLLKALDFADSKNLTNWYRDCDQHLSDLGAMNRDAASFVDYCLALLQPPEPLVFVPRLKSGLRIPVPLIAWCKGVPQSRNYLDKTRAKLGDYAQAQQGEMAEVLGAFRAIHDGGRGGYFLCLLGSFYLRLRDDPTVEREIDGLWIRVNTEGITMYLAEVKEGAATPVVAMNQTEAKLEELGILPPAARRRRIPCPPNVGVIALDL
jgi:hypothetical protein